ARPNSESARKISGTKDNSAKYATIAARCVPRSAKNFFGSCLSPICTKRSLHLRPASVAAVEPAHALADLLVTSPQVAAATAGAAYERRVAKQRDRLDVYFDDGSFVTYVDGSTAAQKLLPLARQVLAAAQEESR